MKQIICGILLLYSSVAHACDVCGASGNNQSLGLLQLYNSHFVGLQYQYRAFTSTHETGLSDKTITSSRAFYQATQLWGRVNIGQRLQLLAFVPYQTNALQEANIRKRYSGVGDISLLASTPVIKTGGESTWQHNLYAAAGIKTPTGEYTSSSSAADGLLNMQPGTGSWDVLINVNYTANTGNSGINTEISATITTANKADYKYGNRYTASLTGFYRVELTNFLLVPQAGIRIEHNLHDYDNYTRKWLNEQTGGTIAYLQTGAQIYYKRIGLQARYHIPVYQYYAKGAVEALYRADLGLLYLFK